MSQVATRVFDFTLILAGIDDFTDDVADRLYELGCDDASFGTSCGVHYGNFHRDAGDLADALASAIRAVEKVGFRVARVDIDAASE
jgi:hypothetical protein